jgi:hypothetical protein
MDMGQVTTVVLVVLFFLVFGLVMFWVYGLTPILHWWIRSNGEQAKAVILEVRTAGWGWYAGSRYSESLVFQPVTVKLEVHPNSGASYIAKDRFNAKPREYRETLKPGAAMQVSISPLNPQWIASWPETAVSSAEPKYNERVLHGSAPAVQAVAPASQKNNSTWIIALATAVALLCGCLGIAGGFAYWHYFGGRSLSIVNSQVATPLPSASSTPVPTSGSNAGVIPYGGLGDKITRATAWGSAISAILQAEPTRCTSPDGAKTTIKVTHQPGSSGAWQERWTVACDGASSIPVDITFTPAGGGVFTAKATLAK